MTDQTQQKGYSPPILTIALPVYNGAATLTTAIKSLLNQSFRDFELIILDDCSEDESVDIMRSFKDSRIRLIEGDENIGLSARLNMAVRLAKGEYFARMDQDDISFPERMDKQLNFLLCNPKVDLLASAALHFTGNTLLGRLPVKTSHADICSRLFDRINLPHPTWMGKTAWFTTHPYRSEADGAEDQDLLLRSCFDSHYACLDEALIAYQESTPSLKKKLRARRIQMLAFVSCFIKRRNFTMVVYTFTWHALKMFGDILFQVSSSKRFRSRLLAPTQQEKRLFHDTLVLLN